MIYNLFLHSKSLEIIIQYVLLGNSVHSHFFCQVMQVNTKDKRMTILYAVPISRWPTLGKENQKKNYTRQPNNNDPSIKEALP